MVYFKFHPRIRSILRFLEKLYLDNRSRANRSHFDIMDEATHTLLKLVNCFLVAMFLCFTCEIGFGIVYFCHGKTIVPVQLPGVDPSSTVGFYVLSSYHLASVVFALNSVYYGDMLFGIWIFFLCPMSKIIHRNVHILNEMLTTQNTTGRRAMISKWLLNIVKMHNDFYW